MGFTKGITPFADWTTSEFNKLKGAKFDKAEFENMETLEVDESTPIANGVDWWHAGYVSSVKN